MTIRLMLFLFIVQFLFAENGPDATSLRSYANAATYTISRLVEY